MVPPSGGHRKANGAKPHRASTTDRPTLPRAAAVVKPRARVRAHSVHRGRFLMRDDPCALLRVPVPRAYSLHGLATPHPVAAGLLRGLFRCGAGKEKPRSGSSTPRLKYSCTEPKEGVGYGLYLFRCCYHLRTEYHESRRKSSPKTIKKTEVVNFCGKSKSVNFSPSAHRVRRAFYATPVQPSPPWRRRWYRSPRGQQGGRRVVAPTAANPGRRGHQKEQPGSTQEPNYTKSNMTFVRTRDFVQKSDFV